MRRGVVELEPEVSEWIGALSDEEFGRVEFYIDLMAARRSWSAIRQARRESAARRGGYRRAKESFEVAERVRRARERAGMTQADLASRIGSSQPAVARLEAGGVTPNLSTLRRIAAALNLELIVDLRPVKLASA